MALFNRNRNSGINTRKIIFPTGKSSAINKKESNTQISINKSRQPFDSLKSKGIYRDTSDNEQLKEIRRVCRDYAKFHDLIPMIITIYAQFPLQGMRIVCRTDEESKLFEEQFFDILDYENYLVEVGKEFFKVGEVNSFGIFDYQSKKWVSEEILDPDLVYVEESVFSGEDVVSLELSDSIKDAVENQNSVDFEYLREIYPDIVDAVNTDSNVLINKDFIFRIVEKAEPWDTRGTPIMTRAFDALLREESLNAAQDAVADRLYSPLILAKLGIPANDIGGQQGAWIPTQGQLDSFAQTFDQALAADFRAIIHHFGIDIKSVFGRESMPDMSKEFERVEKKVMRAFGIGQGLLDGADKGAYAATAINRDFVSQIMTMYQRNIRALFKHRAEIFSRERGIYETVEGENGKEKVATDDVYSLDENGELIVSKVPRVFVPELVFATDPMRDTSFEVNLLNTLSKAGVPVSQQAYVEASGKEINLSVERKRIQSEAVASKLAEVSLEDEIKAELEKREIDSSPEAMDQLSESLESLTPDLVDPSELEDVEQESNTYSPNAEGVK